MRIQDLDTIIREEQAAKLGNNIIDCMTKNSMTLENLDEACEIVRNVYRKNATIKGPTEAGPTV